jgi:hypothetical protein
MQTLYHPSDLPVPPVIAILGRAAEWRAGFVRQSDAAAIRQIDRLIVSVACGARMAWDRGVLLVESLNTPENVYRVRCGQCTCKATKPCWHNALYELLLDLAQTAADTADMEADVYLEAA